MSLSEKGVLARTAFASVFLARKSEACFVSPFSFLARKLLPCRSPLERVAAIENELDLLEQYARYTGLFRHPEMMEFRIGRFVSRWRLGAALAKVERGNSPGRGGYKDFPAGKSFLVLIDKLGVDKNRAQEAQRIACLPPLANRHAPRSCCRGRFRSR